MAYTLHLDKRTEKELRALPDEVQQRVFGALLKLQKDLTAVSSKKLAGEDSYRIRVGSYRVVYDVDTARQEITVLKVAHRKDIYRR